MKYVGSKNNLAKYLLPIIQPHVTSLYIEPFVGGANLIDKVEAEHRVGIDSNRYLIALFDKLQEGWIPPKTISEEEYIKVRDYLDSYPDYYVGLVGFCATYGAKWFGGYARGFKEDKVTLRDIPSEGIRNLLRQMKALRGVTFIHGDYTVAGRYITNEAVVYCDPPYSNSTGYKDVFNHDKFWGWCRQIATECKKLFVSEYAAPKDFKCIWEKEYRTQLETTRHFKRIERLFVYDV